MNKSIFKKTTALLGGLLLAGCNHAGIGGDDFQSETAPDRSVNQFITVQTARGSRADATLRKAHFSGDELNSLGKAKIADMLADEEASFPMKVYVDIGADEAASASSRKSVENYLLELGLRPSQFKVNAGPNAGYTTWAASAIAAEAASSSTPAPGADAPASETPSTPTANSSSK